MNTKLLFCLAGGILCAQVAAARTRPILHGVSPDGRTEVVAVAPDSLSRDSDSEEAYRYRLVLRTRRAGKVLFQSESRWQHQFFSVGTDDSDLVAYWSADSQFLALSFQSTGHALIIRLFSVRPKAGAPEVSLPDLIQPVLTALGGGSLKSLEVEPAGWIGHRLKLRINGTTADPQPTTGKVDFGISAQLRVEDWIGRPPASLSALHVLPVQTGT